VAIVLGTAFGGAWAAVTGFLSLISGQPVMLGDPFRLPPSWQQGDLVMMGMVATWLVLGIVGAVVQFRTTGEEPSAPAAAAAEEPRDRW
jgi:hypothetical protein